MKTFEDMQFESRVGDAFGRAFRTVHHQVQVRHRELLSEASTLTKLYWLELEYNQMILNCLAVDTSYTMMLFFEPAIIHDFLTTPALKQYTVDHPWVVGV